MSKLELELKRRGLSPAKAFRSWELVARTSAQDVPPAFYQGGLGGKAD